jgi:hypothetical protein
MRLVAAAVLALAPWMFGRAVAAAPPPNGGTIIIDSKTADGNDDPAMHTFTDAASEALTAKGFTILEAPAHTAYVAELIVDQAGVGTGMGKDAGGATVGVAGTGLVVPFSTGRSAVVTLQRTRLELRIRKSDDGTVVWDGTAVTVRTTGTRKGTDETVAADLSRALFQAYPTQPEDVVGVP